MNQDLGFSSATTKDALPLAQLHALSWRRTYRGILPDHLLDGPLVEQHLASWASRLETGAPDRQLILLARQAEFLAGFVCVLLDHDPAWGARLENLHVHPECKGQGLGQKLLRRARSWVQAVTPGNSMHLWVFEQNLPARSFYERMGGEFAERNIWELPSGERVPELRYLWPGAARQTI